MKVRINSQCMGDRNCNKLCPEVFEYDEDQLLSRNPGAVPRPGPAGGRRVRAGSHRNRRVKK